MKSPLEQWFLDNPTQTIKIEYDPKGFTLFGAKIWKATLGTPIGSKLGYITNTFEELIWAITHNAD